MFFHSFHECKFFIINTGFKRNRRGTSFIHVTAEAMAKRKEKERERRERIAYRISDDFNEIAHPFDISRKHHYSATNINALLRKTSSPRDGMYSRRMGSESPAQPLLRRCQTTRPIRPGRSRRIEFGGSSPQKSWNRNISRKTNKFNLPELNLDETENTKFNFDFLKVEESVAVMNSTSSEKSSPGSTRIRIDSDSGVRAGGSRSHSVIVFVENSNHPEHCALNKTFESQPLSKTKSLEIRKKRHTLSSDEDKKDIILSPSQSIKRVSYDDEISSKVDITDLNKVDQATALQEQDDSNLDMEQDPKMIEKFIDESLEYCREEENGGLATMNSFPRNSSSYETNYSFAKETVEEKEELCDTDSSIELQTYLGGNIESSI